MDTAKSLLHLHIVYILTWCVNVGYVVYLLQRFVQVKREAEELSKKP